MKDQVVMSPKNGVLAVAIPLYRRHEERGLGSLDGYTISLSDDEPLVYGIDCGPEVDKIHFFNAPWVEKNMIFLGDL